MRKSTETSFRQLFWPGFFEHLLTILVGLIDVVMVSMVGDNAVGAVGTTNTYLTMVSTMLMVMSSGALTVMTQNIGAGHPETAIKAKNVSLTFNAAFGGFFTLVFIFLTGPLLKLLATSDALYDEAVTYMSVVGSSCLLLALNFVFSAYLRSFGHARLTLATTAAGNIINVVLNWIFIKAGKGVYGIAVATFISRLVTVAMSAAFSLRIKEGRGIPCARSASSLFRDIVSIGLPSAGESVAFNICISFVIVCMNKMDTEGIAASVYSYCNQLSSLIYCVGIAASQANAVIVGWRIGEKRFDECFKQTSVCYKLSFTASCSAAIICALASKPLIGLLTDNSEILALVFPVMCINVLRDAGRAGCQVYGAALKTAGDALATLRIGLYVMPLCALCGGLLLGLWLELGSIGAWIGIALDEFIRFVFMRRRWVSGAWKSRILKI